MKLFDASSVPSEEEDSLLMERVKQGDRAAFQRLYEKYRRPIMSFLNAMISDRAVVDELFQESFLKLYRARESYEKRAKFTTFLWTIARHTALDWIEKKKESLADTAEPGIDGEAGLDQIAQLESELPSAEQALIDHLDERAIADCVSRLSESDRLLCGLRMYSELAYEEIAEQVGMPIGTVKTRLHRIREKLARCFRAKQGEAG
jgi:RNA polymerase sigma-70 factor (ECF subfamily)